MILNYPFGAPLCNTVFFEREKSNVTSHRKEEYKSLHQEALNKLKLGLAPKDKKRIKSIKTNHLIYINLMMAKAAL